MRMISLGDAKEGMVLAQTIYGLSGEVLVASGMKLKQKTIEKLDSLFWKFIYIYDEYSQDVEVKCTISGEVRNKAIQHIKALYLTIQATPIEKNGAVSESFSKLLLTQMQSCLGSIDQILDDIITENITLVDLFDIKILENYKYSHSVNVCIISLVLGKALNLNSYELYKLGVGAFFHDMGQMFLPTAVLNKEETYTQEDIKMMQQHVVLGHRYAKDHFNLPTNSYLAILQHHERFDGGGYPHGKTGEEISLYGRIVAIADVFDALTAAKKYRDALTPVNAFVHLINNSSKAFDPKLIKLFISKVSPYPIGFTLNIDENTEAIVIENFENDPFHPKIRIFKEKGVILENPYTKII
ncbi:MAG: HD-GYP domain-containing protein [Vallitaleaceae bacterium]|nr:HD-GYP domain-containing protein [Vallitaleaceae bacterium]